MTSPKFHASLTPMFCYLFYFRDHTYSASLELVILSLVLHLSPPNSATCPPVWFPLIPPSLPLAVAFVTETFREVTTLGDTPVEVGQYFHGFCCRTT